MNTIETRVLELRKNIDMNLQNISEQIEEIKQLLAEFLTDKGSVDEWEDEEEEFDDEVWIEFPFIKSE